MLKIVLPKGSLERLTFELFESADLAVQRSSDREYRATIGDPRVASVAIIRPQEIPTYVEDGHFDLGISGQDLVAESGADVVEVATLPYAKVSPRPARIVLAVPSESGIDHPDQLPPNMTVTTEYTNLTQQYFQKRGLAASVVRSYGSNEAKVLAGIVDAMVHNVETGDSLRRNGLTIVDVLMESWTVLIANRHTMLDPERARAVEEIRILLDGAIRARGRVLVKLNVSDVDLKAVLEILPSMKSPTISELAGGEYYAVETVVDKAQINILIPELKARGASDIIELPIAKIVP